MGMAVSSKWDQETVFKQKGSFLGHVNWKVHEFAGSRSSWVQHPGDVAWLRLNSPFPVLMTVSRDLVPQGRHVARRSDHLTAARRVTDIPACCLYPCVPGPSLQGFSS